MKPTLTLFWGTPPRKRSGGAPNQSETRPNTVQISPNPGSPVVELSPAALPVWQRCRAELERLGFWDDADSFQLARYCEHYAEWATLAVYIRSKGTHQRLISNKGKVYYQKRPELQRMEYLERGILQLERDLGLSRKSRRQLQAAPPSPGEEDQFFRARE